MDTLRIYLNSLTKDERAAYVAACKTSENYLRKAISTGQSLGADLCILLERESNRQVTCEQLRPDVQWSYLRETKPAALTE